jgi:hypothetical protein
MKVILLIDDERDRQFALSTSIVRRIMLCGRSVGGWMTAMLLSKDRKMSERVVDHIKRVSDLSRNRVQCPPRNKSSRDGERAKIEELVTEVSLLQDFVPSLLALGNRGVEEVSTTLIVGKVLDRMISRPFAITVILSDIIFLTVLIYGFRSAIDQLINGGSLEVVLRWIYVANTGIFYFIIREIGKTVSLCLLPKRERVYFLSFWNFTDMLAIALALAATITMRYHFTFQERGLEDASFLRGLLAVTTGFLWLRVLSLLKAMNMQLATFVLAILHITKDILWFCVILFTLLVSFAQIFYTLLAPSSCTSDSSAMECKKSEYYLGVYTLLLGDFSQFGRDQLTSGFSIFLMVLYSFMVTVVLLNVLIAVASDSYEKCLIRSHNLFGRARVMLIAELVSFQNLLRKTEQNREDQATVQNCSKGWSSGPLNQDWSRGSVLFFSLSLFVMVAWIIGEIVGFANGEQHGNVLFSLASILVNFVLFVVIMVFLASGAAGIASKREEEGENGDRRSGICRCFTNYGGFVQSTMLRMLGTSKDTDDPFKVNENEEWTGRVRYLQREMERIAEVSAAAVKEQSKVMENHVTLSESRVRAEMGALRAGFESLTANVMNEARGTQKTNALVTLTVEELKSLIHTQSTVSGFRSPVPSEVDLNDTTFLRYRA